jgi:hypothetical protein
MLAWLESLKPENQGPEPTLQRIKMLDKAIASNDRLERAFFYRGMLYKRMGDLHNAVVSFRKAADLNPRNLDAVREVRLFEMRRSKGSIPPPPAAEERSSARPGPYTQRPGASKEKDNSLFGKLFKK